MHAAYYCTPNLSASIFNCSVSCSAVIAAFGDMGSPKTVDDFVHTVYAHAQATFIIFIEAVVTSV